MNLISRLTELFTPAKPLPEGMFHRLALSVDDKPYRMHLRLQKNGNGVLILNASTVLQLNSTACEYAYHMIKGAQPEQAAKAISSRYRVPVKDALRDYQEFFEKIEMLINATDLDPVSVLGFDQAQPNSAELSAPLRLDVALTYRLPSGSDPINAPARRVDRELTTQEWQDIFDKAWAKGVPQIVFTGGEATLRDDLFALIAHAEKNGQVTGLITDGSRLSEQNYLDELLQTGLDHLLLLLPISAVPDWKLISHIVDQDIFFVAHQTLTQQNITQVSQNLSHLKELGVENVSISVTDPALMSQSVEIGSRAIELGLRLVSDLPVPYSESHPVAMEVFENSEPAGAGKAWLYIEPDGDVLPSQGAPGKILGNLLRDTWETIYPQLH